MSGSVTENHATTTPDSPETPSRRGPRFPSAAFGQTFRSLKVRNYRLFATGQVVSLVGNWMQFTAQDWTVLHVSGNSGSALGWVTALQFLPVVLLTLYGGKLADRYDKRALLLCTNIGAGLVALALGALTLSGHIQLWHVFVLAACLGTVNAIDNPARQSFVSEMVGAELLPNAVSLNGAVFNAARVIGPAVAGVSISLIGTGPVFLLNFLTYAATCIALKRMRPAELHRSTAPTTQRETRVVDGLRYAAARPDLMLPMVLMLVIGGLGFKFQLSLALVSKTVFHRGAASFGLLTTMLAVGALIGALASSRRSGRPSSYLVIGAAFAFGIFEVLAGFAPSYLAEAGLLVLTGFFMIFLAQAANQRIQLGVSEAYRGRVMALYVLMFQGSTPVFAPMVGWLAENLGARSSLWVGGLASVLSAAAVLAYRSKRRGVQVRLRARPVPHVQVTEPSGLRMDIPAGRARIAR
ncbi:MAG: MFS transporter [Actinocatenispora sp.]